MATKPSTVFTFSTNAVYAAGPFIGLPNKAPPADVPNGFVPGTEIDAEEHNYMLHWTGDWLTDWVDLGTSAADLDAHIIETDATGVSNIAGLVLGGTAAAFRGLVVSENAGASNAAMEVTNVAGGFAVTASNSDSSATIRATNSGTGPGLEGRTTGGTDNNGVEGYGAGTGNGVYGESGDSVLAAGVRGESDASVVTTVGLYGQANHDDATAILGTTTATASGTSIAVLGSALGDAVGVRGQSQDGYGVVCQADTSSPIRAALRTVPQDDDPSSGAEGDWIYNSTTDEARAYVNSRWQTLMSQQNGYTRAVSALTTATNNNAGVYTDLVTISISAPYEPKHTGTVMIQAGAEFGAAGGSIHTAIDVRLYDDTAGATVWSQTIDHPAAVAGPIYDRPWSIMVPYGLPGTGSRTFKLQFKKTGGVGTGIDARDASLFIHGVY